MPSVKKGGINTKRCLDVDGAGAAGRVARKTIFKRVGVETSRYRVSPNVTCVDHNTIWNFSGHKGLIYQGLKLLGNRGQRG